MLPWGTGERSIVNGQILYGRGQIYVVVALKGQNLFGSGLWGRLNGQILYKEILIGVDFGYCRLKTHIFGVGGDG